MIARCEQASLRLLSTPARHRPEPRTLRGERDLLTLNAWVPKMSEENVVFLQEAYGSTALHIAADAGRTSSVRALVAAGASLDLIAGGVLGMAWTPLMFATDAGHHACRQSELTFP